MEENEVPHAPNNFSYYVVAHWTLPGTVLSGYVPRQIIVDVPFTEAAEIENLAAGIAKTIPVEVRGQNNAMLVGNDVPKLSCVIVMIHELRAWYDPRPVAELVRAMQQKQES